MGKLSRMRAFEVGLESGHVLDLRLGQEAGYEQSSSGSR